MKIDPRSVVLGSLLSLIMFVSIAYASTIIRKDFQIEITVPSEKKLEVLSENTLLKFEELAYNFSQLDIIMKNSGTQDLFIVWRTDGEPDKLRTELQYDLGGPFMVWNGRTKIPRGYRIKVRIRVFDDGAPPGDYAWKLIFEEG